MDDRRDVTDGTERAGIVASSALLALTVFLLVLDTGGGAPGEVGTGGAVGEIETRVASELDASVDDEPLRGGIRVTAGDVVWNQPNGRRWLAARRVSGVLDGGALQGGAMVLRDVRLEQPRLDLERAPSGAWNFQRALERGGGARAGGGSGNAVTLRDVAIVGGHVDVTLPQGHYVLASLDARLPEARLAGPDAPFARIATLDGRLSLEGNEPRALSLRDARIRPTGDGVTFTADRLAVANSVVTGVEGRYSSRWPGLGIRARGHAPHVDFADLHGLVPAFPERGVATLDFSTDPTPSGLAVRLTSIDMTSSASHVTGALTVVVGGAQPRLGAVDLRLDPLDLAFLEDLLDRPLPYSGTVSGSLTGSGDLLSFDLSGALGMEGLEEPIDARVQGRLTLAGLTPTIRGMTVDFNRTPLAALRGLVPGLPFSGYVTGRVSFDGEPGSGPLRVNATLALADGTVSVEGTVDPRGVPSYDLTGRIEDINLREFLEPDVPPVTLDARFTLSGAGTNPRTADARFRVDGRFSGWQSGPADILAVQGSLGGGTLSLDRFALQLATLTAGANGRWRLTAPSGGSIEYTIDVRSLTPFAPYLPGDAPEGTGTFASSGTVTGTLDDPHVAGTVKAGELRYAGWAATALDGKFDVAMTDSLPQVNFDLTSDGLVTPIIGAYESVTAHLDMTPPQFSMSFEGDRVGGGVVQVLGEGRMPRTRAADLVLNRVVVDLGKERWALAAPAAIDYDQGAVSVDSLVVHRADGSGRFALSGQLLPLGEANVAFDLESLPLAEVERLVSRQPTFGGRLSAVGMFDARGETPTFQLDFSVDSASAPGVRFARLGGNASYDGARIDIDATGDIAEPGGSFTVDAQVPLTMVLKDSVAVSLPDAGALAGTVRFEQLPIAAVERLTNAVRDTRGTISGDLRLAGTIADPSLNGSIQVADGELVVESLHQRFRDIHGTVQLAGARATFEDLQVRSGGLATVTGDVVFEQLNNPVAHLVVHLDGFRPMGVDNEKDAAATGSVNVDGPIRTPVITGHVALDDGYVEVPGGGTADPLAGQVSEIAMDPIEVEDLPGAKPPAFGNYTIQNLQVDAGDDLWFKTEQARAQLSGELTVFHSGSETRIFGALKGERGVFTLRAGAIVRRFEIRDATIRFFGTPDLNPALEVTATRVVGGNAGEPVELVVHVGGTVQHPTVALSSGDGTPIPESELLSFLLFGQSNFGAGTVLGGGNQGLAALASGLGFSDILSSGLEQQGLPIDYIQIRSGTTGDASQLSIAVGTEIVNDVFLTLDTPLNAQSGSGGITVSLEWRIDDQWSLELAHEPTHPQRAFGGLGFGSIIRNGVTEQWTAEVRRRWTY